MTTILIIESNLNFADQIQQKLLELKTLHLDIQFIHTTSLQGALAILKEKKVDLIITNLFLSDYKGPEVITKLSEGVMTIPILFCGDKIDESLAETAIHLGAQDFFDITKNNHQVLARLIRYSIERQHLMDTLRALSFTDELTGIYNRRGFITLAEQQMEISRRSGHGFVLYVMDVDYLKRINDTYGHQVGDQALISVTQFIKKNLRRYDIVGRMGGDEFAAIAIDLSQSMEMNIKDKLTAPINTLQERPYPLTCSVGSAYYHPTQSLSFEELFERADKELYQAKQSRVPLYWSR